ncbi:MAG: peptide deformylase [Oscillospiraceae bacterium]|nr:peptide deformylase [Oscillospiraceae bacterium]
MALRNILNLPDETLFKKSREITSFDDKLWVLLDDMHQTLTSENGVGIAAVQVGILRRAIVIDLGEGEVIELINPEIVQKKGKQCELEGCLSFSGKWGYVERPAYVKVKSLNRYGKPQTHEGTELLAIVLCHELDHLDGIMFNDIAVEMLDREPTDEEFEQRNKRIGIKKGRKKR